MKLETQVGIFILSALGVFLYLSINIKAFRFDKDSYYEYKTYFDDTGGVAVKSAVKIAGVDVGWVDEIHLLNGGKAELMLRVNRKNKLAKNAFATIHQDGLIGTKSVEIDPGDPSTGLLLPGSTLSMPGRTPASVGELLEQFRTIASTVQDITTSLKNVVASRQGENNMKHILASAVKATDRIADFSLVMQRTMERNERRIDSLVSDIAQSAAELKSSIPALTKDVSAVANTIDQEVKKVGPVCDGITDASVEVKNTFRDAGIVVEKINSGKGVVGKLINEDETYNDLKKSIRGIKSYVSKNDALMLNVDMHGESMIRTGYSKGYFDLRLRPVSDYFYQVQMVADEYGSIRREVEDYVRKDDQGNILTPRILKLENAKKIEFADTIERTTRVKNAVLFGLQFGKRFDRLAFRIGLFDSTFGVGCDYYVPLKTDKVHWITSLEAYDFTGVNRLHDTRPHLKWLNKLFVMRNFYTVFGVDDMYSRQQASPFWGGGFRFGDDDLKYFASLFQPKKA